MSKVLMTGASGFIGKHLVKRLRKEGYNIFPFIPQSSQNAGVFHQDPFVRVGDLTDYESLYRAVQTVVPEVIIHLGALTPVRLSWLEPIHYQMVNYMGTVNLIEACINILSPMKFRFIYASTAEVYGEPKNPVSTRYIGNKLAFCEEEHLNPISPYSVSKACAEHYLQMRRLSYPFKLTVLRANNTYGRPYSGYFVESMMEQILYPIKEAEKLKEKYPDTVVMYKKPTVTLYYPNHIRDYLFIDDHVNAYAHVLENKLEGIYNVAQGEPISNIEMVWLMASLMGVNVEIREREPDLPRPCDQKAIIQDCTKLRRAGWKPEYTRAQGILKLRAMYK